MTPRRPARVFVDRGVYARLVLGIADVFRRPLRKIGVDPESFHTLLEVELALERRRAKTAARRGEGTPGTLAKALSFGFNTFVGGLGAIAIGALAAHLSEVRADVVHAHMYRAETVATRAVIALGEAGQRRPYLVATIHSSRQLQLGDAGP